MQLMIFWNWECNSASTNCLQTNKISKIFANCQLIQEKNDSQNQNNQIQRKNSQNNH